MSSSEIRDPLSTQTRGRLDAFFASIGQGFNAYIETISRRHQIETLYARSDAELADMGLTREDIPRHVFRDKLGS
jgi:uncharacterized protein YjiS (DUF1127 family)